MVQNDIQVGNFFITVEYSQCEGNMVAIISCGTEIMKSDKTTDRQHFEMMSCFYCYHYA